MGNKRYYSGDERPYEVSSLSIYDEKVDSRVQFIYMPHLARSSPRRVALPDGGDIVGQPSTVSLFIVRRDE